MRRRRHRFASQREREREAVKSSALNRLSQSIIIFSSKTSTSENRVETREYDRFFVVLQQMWNILGPNTKYSIFVLHPTRTVLALFQPLANLGRDEEPVPVVDFGASGTCFGCGRSQAPTLSNHHASPPHTRNNYRLKYQPF